MARSIKMQMITAVIALAVCLMPVLSVFALSTPDLTKRTSLSMTLKTAGTDVHYASGAKITAYKVADIVDDSGSAGYKLTADYSSSGIDLKSKITQSVIDDLVKYTENNGITGRSETADAGGKVIFDNLECAVYLVTAASLPDGFSSFVPFVYFLPFYDKDSGTWVYDGVAEPKISYQPPADVSVKKVWNDDGKSRPASVTVELSNEDGVFDTVVLDQANGWKHVWRGLDAGKKWKVKEINVPKGYKETYSSKGFAFTVTNTEKLIQTGQVSWPVPVLVFAGVFLICAGIIIKAPQKSEDEE